MTSARLIRWMKICMVVGILLILTGHYLLAYYNLPEKIGVKGMVIGASCIAVGLVFSLPTKMYLTFLLVKREIDKKKNNGK
jgi:nitrate reductase gamma subunit